MDTVDLPLDELDYWPNCRNSSKFLDLLRVPETRERVRAVKPKLFAVCESMELTGQEKPVIVVANPAGGWQVHTGNQRLTCARALGWTHLRAIVADDLTHARSLVRFNFCPPTQCGRCNRLFYVSHRCPKKTPESTSP